MQRSSNHLYRKKLGKKGEDMVAQWLTNHGFSICAQNYQKRCGEIDIVAKKDDVLIFVEVKSRSSIYFNLSQVIVKSKQKKIIRTAQYYIAEHRIYDTVIRFDVALIEKNDTDFEIMYIPNAFTQK